MSGDVPVPVSLVQGSSARAEVRADESGQGLAEYGLILGFIAVVCVASVTFLGGQIQGMFSQIGSTY